MRPRLALWWALFAASVKMFVRNRVAVFFSLFLPLIIMLIFGVLNFEGSTTISLGIVDEAETDASAALIDGLHGFEYLEISEGGRESELAELAEGDRGFVLVVPSDYQPLLGAETGLVAYAASSDPAQAQVAQGLLQQAIASVMSDSLNGSIPDIPRLAPPVEFGSVESRDLGYIDFLVPGIVGMTVMQLGLFGVAVGFGVAGWAKNEDQAAPVANLISLPMLFLSGVFFPRDAMPEFLRGITQYMPLTYVNEALRGVMNDGAGLVDLGPQLLGMGVWAVITFVIAVRLFKWE